MDQIEMSVEQWFNVLDNPRQRDTERHAAFAINRHLKSHSKAQARVSAAMLPDGLLVKLDGHTRGLLWNDGRLTPPPRIRVDVYPVESMEEAKDLYTHFDNQGAVEGARDKLTGAFREFDINPQSDLLRTGGITSALNNLTPKGTSVYAAVKAWRPELLLLDSLNLTKAQYRSEMIIGALALLRVRKNRAMEFLRLVGQDAGKRDENGSDGVDAFCRYVGSESVKKDDKMAIAGKFVSAGETFIQGEYYTGGLKPTNIVQYLSRAGSPISAARPLKIAA